MSQKQGRFLTGSTMSHVVKMTLSSTIGLTFMFLIDVATLFWISRMGVEQNMAALVLFFRDDILAMAGAKGETLAIASRFLLISVPSLPLMALGMVGSGLLRAEGVVYGQALAGVIAGALAATTAWRFVARL